MSRAVGPRDLGADRGRHAVAQGRPSDGIEERSRMQHREAPLHPVIDAGLVVHHDRVFGQRRAQRLDQALDLRRVAGTRRGSEAFAPAMIPARARRARAQALEQPGQPVLRVADDRQLRLEEAADDGGIEVEMDQGLRRRKREVQQEPLGRSVGEAAADRQDHVGRLDDRLGGPTVRQHAVPQRIALADRAPTHDRRDHRSAQATRQRHELGLGVRGDHAAAGDQQRPGCGGQQTRRLLDRLDVTRRPAAMATAVLFGVKARGEEVVGHGDRDRTGTSGAQQIERAVHGRRYGRRLGDGFRPARDRPEAVDLVGHLVQGADVAPDERRGDVGHDHEHRHRSRIRLDQWRQRIRRARTGGDDDHTRRARGARVAVGHEGRPRFVAGQHVHDRRLTDQRVVDRQIVDAGNAEHVAHALGPERVHDPLAARSLGPLFHGLVSPPVLAARITAWP